VQARILDFTEIISDDRNEAPRHSWRGAESAWIGVDRRLRAGGLAVLHYTTGARFGYGFLVFSI